MVLIWLCRNYIDGVKLASSKSISTSSDFSSKERIYSRISMPVFREDSPFTRSFNFSLEVVIFIKSFWCWLVCIYVCCVKLTIYYPF